MPSRSGATAIALKCAPDKLTPNACIASRTAVFDRGADGERTVPREALFCRRDDLFHSLSLGRRRVPSTRSPGGKESRLKSH